MGSMEDWKPSLLYTAGSSPQRKDVKVAILVDACYSGSMLGLVPAEGHSKRTKFSANHGGGDLLPPDLNLPVIGIAAESPQYAEYVAARSQLGAFTKGFSATAFGAAIADLLAKIPVFDTKMSTLVQQLKQATMERSAGTRNGRLKYLA